MAGLDKNGPDSNTGTLEKMIVASGSLALDLDLNRLNGGRAARARQTRPTTLNFETERDAFFTVLVFNDELRGPLPSALPLIPQNTVALPARLRDSYQQLVLENTSWGGQSDLVIRDAKSGFTFFTVEGQEFEYEPAQKLLNITTGRVLLAKEFADALGRPGDANALLGTISLRTVMKPIEITKYVDGEVESESMPSLGGANAALVPGPDVIVGDVVGLAQFGAAAGTQVGLSVGTDSCNFGTIDLNWFANPSNDHPVIPQNLYRMSGGADNAERFEQIGQSSVKHGFTALTQNICNLGCNGVGGTRLGSGCSDPYSASLNSGPNLGSRAWINPFTGAFPRNDSATPNNNHSGHTHLGPSHRILTEISDLNTSLNQGASYFAEAQYITPHEYAWCQTNPGQCNMYNNVSYRRYTVSGTTSPFSFSPAAATVRTQPAISAWTGATLVDIKPDPVNDGVGIVGYKVTQTAPGTWHYEYAVYNQNMDRAIQSFSIPVGGGVTLTNVGFKAPPQHPGWSGDGTVNNAGFSSAPWTSAQAGGALTWSSETFAQNPNANAIRWGTMYNFRFDSNRPPTSVNATIGFFKTGAPITVGVQGPSAAAAPVTVSGRVMTAGGQMIANARVTLTDSQGNARTEFTGTFGTFSFGNVATGGNYTLRVFAKRYTFADQVIQVSDNVLNLAVTSQENP